MKRYKPILEVRGTYHKYGEISALSDVDLEIFPGEVFGIVGESGSGKSTLLRMLNLEETPNKGEYHIHHGSIANSNLWGLGRMERQEIRIQHMGIVYQSPHLGLRMNNTSSGNIAGRLLIAGERHFNRLREVAAESLNASDFPIDRMDDIPSHLSGGMQQRVQIAKAIALKPIILLLDEPTSGLDLSVQAKVLDTLCKLKQETHMTVILVSHDLGVIRTLADRVLVMRHGHAIETGLTDQILQDPQHPYTQELVYAKL